MQRTISKKKLWLFRCAAIIVGLIPFVVLELTLRAFDSDRSSVATEVSDPYVGFSEVFPLFTKSSDGSRFETASNRLPLFQPDSFAAAKDANEFRIFCLGGSTVQGRPYSIETSFTTWLELALKASDTERDWDVINCGGVSYASYRLVPIMEEVMTYQPDLIILYTGHNEFLEDRTYAQIKSSPALIRSAHERLSSLRSYQLLRRMVKGERASESLNGKTSGRTSGKTVAANQETLPAEVEARLDFQGGLELYHRDDTWHSNVMKHFEFNLHRMVDICQQNNVPIMLCHPVSNLRDIAPFKSELDPALSAADRERCEELLIKIESTTEADRKVELMKSLLAIDPRHAMTQFQLAQTYLAAGNIEQSKDHFLLAKENDICPLRILEPMKQTIHDVIEKRNVIPVDFEPMLQQLSPDGLIGRESLVDHVHPRIYAHQKMGEVLRKAMEDAGFTQNKSQSISTLPSSTQSNSAQSPDDWEAVRNQAFEAHLKTLPFMYFQRGKDRLAGLKRWAEGRVTKERQRKND